MLTARELVTAVILSEFESRARREVRARPDEHVDAIVDVLFQHLDKQGWAVVRKSEVMPPRPTLTEMGWALPVRGLPNVHPDTSDPMS